MPSWRCAIEECGSGFESAERLIRHQADEHDPATCRVCGQSIPAGYLAIRHAFGAHTRAEYLRAYAATTEDIRARENVADRIEAVADISSVLDALGIEAVTATGED